MAVISLGLVHVLLHPYLLLELQIDAMESIMEVLRNIFAGKAQLLRVELLFARHDAYQWVQHSLLFEVIINDSQALAHYD